MRFTRSSAETRSREEDSGFMKKRGSGDGFNFEPTHQAT